MQNFQENDWIGIGVRYTRCTSVFSKCYAWHIGTSQKVLRHNASTATRCRTQRKIHTRLRPIPIDQATVYNFTRSGRKTYRVRDLLLPIPSGNNKIPEALKDEEEAASFVRKFQCFPIMGGICILLRGAYFTYVSTFRNTLPPTFSLKKEIDKDEIRRNKATWKTKNKILKSIDFNNPPDAMSAVKAGEMFLKLNAEDVHIDPVAIVEKYLRTRKRNWGETLFFPRQIKIEIAVTSFQLFYALIHELDWFCSNIYFHVTLLQFKFAFKWN